jgi:hypothetical protein
LRIPYSGPVRISWNDKRGDTKYAEVKCLDVSEAGLRIEAPESIAPGTYVTLRADRINVYGTACVKNVAGKGTKFILGLELSAQLRGKAVAKLTEPAPTSAPLPVLTD